MKKIHTGKAAPKRLRQIVLTASADAARARYVSIIIFSCRCVEKHSRDLPMI